jgi:hypothetical protein
MKQIMAYECSDGSAIVGKREAEAYERGLRLLDHISNEIGSSTTNDGQIITVRKNGRIVATGVGLKYLADNWDALSQVCDLDAPPPIKMFGETHLIDRRRGEK